MSLKILNELFSSDFNRNAAKLFSGSVISSVLSLVAIQIITFLFEPGDYGNFQLISSTILVIAGASTFRYQLAIVIAKNEEEFNHAATLTLAILVITCLTSALIFIFLGEVILEFLNAIQLINYRSLIVLGIFIAGLSEIFRHILIAKKLFGTLAINKIVQNLMNNIFSISVGYFIPTFVILYWGFFIGHASSLALILRKVKVRFSNSSLSNLVDFAKVHKKFPLYDTPSTFLNNFSAQLPVFIISKYHGIEVLGIYILANRLIDVPVQLILRSVSQVYLPSINDAYLIGRDKVMEFFKMTFKKLTILTIIIMVPAFLLSPYVNLFFGDKWVGVSLFLQIILIYKSFQLINSPLSITLTVMKKQEVSLILTIISIVVRLVSMYIFRENVISMIIAFSISTSAFHVAYLIVVYFHINKISHNSPLG